MSSSSVYCFSSFIHSGAGSGAFVATELIFIFGVRQDWEEPDVLFVANVQQSFTPNDVGELFTIDTSVDDDFPTICDLLTNGTNNLCYVGYEIPNGVSGIGTLNENFLFQGGVTGEFNPDFQGCTIHGIVVTPTTLTLNTPGSGPNEDGIWTDFDFELRVYGYHS